MKKNTKQQSDREEFENGVGDEMFSHFYEPYQQNHKDEVWAWIESKLKQAKQEGVKEVLEEKEINLIVTLLKTQKASCGFLRGFGKPSQHEQDENAYYNRLIEKLSNLNNQSKNV